MPFDYYECGICDGIHHWDWNGDCREYRLSLEDLSDGARLASWEERQKADEEEEDQQ